MTLNLNKYGSEMQAAWKEVCDVNSETNWALFGYEGTSFTLKLLASGSDGLEELKEELNANKIMYAFIRVDDPKTSLPKFVFIHWQGESAAGTRKGVCATHLRDIERYFHGAHVTINARNEDEVDESEILSKVSKATASAFNFKEKPCTMMDEAPAPVGTTHQRIVPQKELPTMNEREKFWIQEESKEKERIEAEKIRKISERKLIEEERRRREEEENKLREASIKERERKISKIRDAEATTKKDNSSEWEKQLEDDAKEEESRQKRSEELRKARNEEARQLISQRSGNARAVFERNTSVGQLNYRRSTSLQQNGEENRNLTAPVVPAIKPSEASASPQAAPAPVSPLATPVSPQAVPAPASPKASPPQASPTKSPEPKFDVRKSEARSPNLNHVNANVVHTDDIVVPPPEFFSNEDMMKPEEVFCEPDITSNSHQPDLIQDVAASKVVPDVTASAGHTSASVQNGSSTDCGVCAVALYDYEAADETEISFDPGQVITHIDQIDPGWWQGLGPDGNYGLFPANYVEIIDSSEIEQH